MFLRAKEAGLELVQLQGVISDGAKRLAGFWTSNWSG